MKIIRATQVRCGDTVEGVGLVTQVLFRADGKGVTLWTGDVDAPRENRTSRFFWNLETVEVISFEKDRQVKATEVNRGDAVEGVGFVTRVLLHGDGSGVTLVSEPEEGKPVETFFARGELVEVTSFAEPEPKPERKMTLREALTVVVERKNNLDEFIKLWGAVNKTIKPFCQWEDEFHLLDKIETENQTVVVYWRDRFGRGHVSLIERSRFEESMAENLAL